MRGRAGPGPLHSPSFTCTLRLDSEVVRTLQVWNAGHPYSPCPQIQSEVNASLCIHPGPNGPPMHLRGQSKFKVLQGCSRKMSPGAPPLTALGLWVQGQPPADTCLLQKEEAQARLSWCLPGSAAGIPKCDKIPRDPKGALGWVSPFNRATPICCARVCAHLLFCKRFHAIV